MCAWLACLLACLKGDQTNKVVYGAMEHGQPLRENEKVASLLKDVGPRLMIAEREMDAVPIKKPPSAAATTVRDVTR